MQRCDLSHVVLENLERSLESLYALGALDEQGHLSSPVRQRMAELPLHPMSSATMLVVMGGNIVESYQDYARPRRRGEYFHGRQFAHGIRRWGKARTCDGVHTIMGLSMEGCCGSPCRPAGKVRCGLVYSRLGERIPQHSSTKLGCSGRAALVQGGVDCEDARHAHWRKDSL